MSTPITYAFDRQRIVVAEEDSFTAAFLLATLRRDGHCVTHHPGVPSALDPELDQCQLLISTLQGSDVPRVDLLEDLRERWPFVPILYLTSAGDATAVPEAQFPRYVQVLRTPFTAEELRAAVRRILPLHAGTVLALPLGEPASLTDPCGTPPAAASASERTNA